MKRFLLPWLLALVTSATLVSQSATIATKTCTLVLQAATSPDGLAGWRVQFKRGASSHGTSDTSAPYGPKSATVDAGTYALSAVWTKDGQLPTTQDLGTATCAGGVIVPPVTPPPTTNVNAVVSDWSLASSVLGACVNGLQTVTETWTRTVLTPAQGTGTTPPLSEPRTRTQVCTVTPPPSGTKRLLVPADLTYLGFYDLMLNGQNSSYGQSLTHRYVGGDLRLLTISLGGGLDEFSLAGKSFGQMINAKTNYWNLPSALAPGQVNVFNGIWWDEATQRLFHTSSGDYSANNYPAWVDRVALGPNGAISNAHTVTLGTIPWKRVYGGVQPIPASFQAQFGGKKYVVGWGGYTSLLHQGGGASLGPAMYGIPDPAGFAHNANIQASQVLTVMDTSGSSVRGRRVTLPINYYDSGDPRPNPPTAPTVPPAAGAQWLSPGPDGLGYMVWGDSYYNTGMWIDTPTRQGFVLVASLGGEMNYYANSTLHSAFRQFEWHIFNPATMQATNRPATMTAFMVPGLGTLDASGNTGNSPHGNLSGATFVPATDSTGTGRIYVLGSGMDFDIFRQRIYVFGVN